ncbi:type IV pilin protein [Thioalkalivibrio sp. ALMg9]|uniref:type IV pilin protein n=1 Tax=Thioalkalivibrio sp. ALMg9 TaxID=1266912 RepID=UPI000360E708|nr:type IV pilin protein [Thioalkalivibrio sp. ALMg9]
MNQPRKPSAGFTLIELMIVVAVIGILAAIAYPAYNRFVENSRMATAQGDLMELAQFMERQYSVNNRYNSNVSDAGDLPFQASPRDGGTTVYTFSFQAGPAPNSFTLQAIPTGPQTGHRCGTLTLDSTGDRGAAETNCWN